MNLHKMITVRLTFLRCFSFSASFYHQLDCFHSSTSSIPSIRTIFCAVSSLCSMIERKNNFYEMKKIYKMKKKAQCPLFEGQQRDLLFILFSLSFSDGLALACLLRRDLSFHEELATSPCLSLPLFQRSHI